MRLIIIVAAAISGFVLITLVFFQATRKTYPGFGRWTSGVGFLTVGYLALALRGFIPDALSIFIGNVAFPLGMVLLLDGLRRFLGLAHMSRLWYALPAMDLVAIAVLYYLHDAPFWRTVVTAIAISAPHWPMAALIFRHPLKHESIFYPVIGSLLVLGGLVVLARPIAAFFLPQWHLFMDSPFQLGSFVMLIVLQLGESLSLMMLNSERVESELVEAEAELRLTVDRLQQSLAEQKRAEESLRDSEERYRTFFETSRDCVFMTTLDGRFIEFNDVALEILGYAPIEKQELLRRKVTSFYANPEEREAHAAMVAEVGFSKEYPVDLRKQDGTIIHTLITTVARKDPQGNIIGFQGTVRDITERKKAEDALRASEERYRAVFDNAGMGIDLLDRDGRILQVNQSLLDMLGYSEEELHQLTFLDITHPEEREISKRNLEALMAGEIEFYRLEKRYLRKDRSILWADLTTSAIRGPNGEHSGTIGVISDITERKKAEQEREQLRNQLAQAQKMEAIGTLTGGIAHDFNNLLTVILGYSEMLLMDRDEKDSAYDDLQKIMQSARNGAEMVQRLLVFSRKAETNPVPLDLNRQIRNTEPLLSHTLPKMIRIEMRLADDLGLVHADPAQMDQIVMNLAINAKEAMPDGGILTLETSNVTLESEFCARHPGVEPGDYVLLSISDTGRGMDKEIQDRMFDPFFTVKGWDSRKGTGLGLPVVLGIVQHHGGCIECLSEVGKGTTFNIYLPKFTAEPLSDQADSRDVPALGTETILLVDDEDLVRELGERILTKSGYRVLTARNGREALDIYKQHQPDVALVILDLIMPEMSGKDCLLELIKIDPQVRVIVSSGHSDSEDPHEVPHEFVRASVKKPYGVGQLLQTVRKVLDET